MTSSRASDQGCVFVWEDLNHSNGSAHVYHQTSIISVYCQHHCSQWMPHSEDVALLTLPTPFPKQLMYELARTAHTRTHTVVKEKGRFGMSFRPSDLFLSCKTNKEMNFLTFKSHVSNHLEPNASS